MANDPLSGKVPESARPPRPKPKPPANDGTAEPPKDAPPGVWWQSSCETGWTRIKEPILPSREDEGLNEWFKRCGYVQAQEYGHDASDLSLEVYRLERPHGPECGIAYLLGFNTVWSSDLIACPTLPDLLGFLRKMLPMVASAMRIEQVAERIERRLRRRGLGPRYDSRRRSMTLPD
jgi:hypothetical protein